MLSGWQEGIAELKKLSAENRRDERNHLEIFGDSVAAQLKTLPVTLAASCQAEIQQLLTIARLNHAAEERTSSPDAFGHM